jgi:predicted amidophosphoribosyltransferase
VARAGRVPQPAKPARHSGHARSAGAALRSQQLWVEGRVPIRQRVVCPGCAAELVRKPGGRCPACGAAVAQHVQAVRDREERIERVVAVVGTVLVVALLAMTAGLG